MQMRLFTRRQVSLFVVRVVGCALIGLVFGGAVGAAVFKPALFGAVFGGLAGAIYCTALMVFIGGAEMFLPRTRWGQALERSPLPVAIGVKALAYSAVIIVIVGGRLGLRAAVLIAGMTVEGDFALSFEQQARSTIPGAVMIATAILLVACFLLLRELNHLVGNRTFRAIALGRYHQPRLEERFFLFVDIVGSTPLAERLGPASVHAFLDRVFQIASDPIDDHDGEVYQYVGDEMVITWTVAEGRRGARPLACLFAIEAALKLAAPDFMREFGAAPELRAALHAGPVTTGEVGGSRRAIVFHGDVMNTASRLENATRELERPFLVSEDALCRLEASDAYALLDLGQQQLRGRAAPVHIYAVASARRLLPPREQSDKGGSMRLYGVRYQVKDVGRSIDFYTQRLGFKLDRKHLPAFAQVSAGDFRLTLSGPGASGSRPMPDGHAQEPGGWNRVMLEVADLASAVEALKQAGVRFRNEVEAGPGGKQIQLLDPDGNPLELFEPAR